MKTNMVNPALEGKATMTNVILTSKEQQIMQKSGNGVRHHNYEAIVAWAEGKMISFSTDGGNSWEKWDTHFGFTPFFGAGDPRIMFRVGTPTELKGIHQDDILAYCEKKCGDNSRNYLLVKLDKDDGTDIPLCKVVVGNEFYSEGETVWCDLNNLTKVFPDL